MKKNLTAGKNSTPGAPKQSKSISGKENIHRLAFENSSQPNIISTVSTGKILIVNSAACKLLGYSNNELVRKNRKDIFDINERSFKKMLAKRTSEEQSIAFVSAIRKNGKPLRCQITSDVFIDTDGVEKSITTVVDISKSILDQKNIDARKKKIVLNDIIIAKSKQKEIDTRKDKQVADDIIVAQEKSNARLAENNEWIKCIAKASYDVMWDWDIATGEIYVGDSLEEVYGHKIDNNKAKFSDFIRCLIRQEKDKVKQKLNETLAGYGKSWNDSFTFTRRDGSLALTKSRGSIVRDGNGNAIRVIGAIHDISYLKELESKLDKHINIPRNDDTDKFLLSAKLSCDVLWDWKITTNEIFIGEGFEELFGYKIENNKGEIAEWGIHIHPDDVEAFKNHLDATIASSAAHWQHIYRLTKADGSIARVFDKANIFRNESGKAYRMIGVMQDVTSQKENQQAGAPVSKKAILIEKIKNAIRELIHFSVEQLQTNFSAHLSKTLQYDYTYLANIFSEVEGIPIRQFIIEQKIERVKELITDEHLNLTEIATKLHYSSTAHLSNQFKKVTGFTPSHYKHHGTTQQ